MYRNRAVSVGLALVLTAVAASCSPPVTVSVSGPHELEFAGPVAECSESSPEIDFVGLPAAIAARARVCQESAGVDGGRVIVQASSGNWCNVALLLSSAEQDGVVQPLERTDSMYPKTWAAPFSVEDGPVTIRATAQFFGSTLPVCQP
jgi:hypothetical protein